MKPFLSALLVCLVISCTSTKKAFNPEGYGYTESNPIKVGGVDSGPRMERQYLNSLTGPNGETVRYHRLGSCCMFESSKSPLGGGMLDIYEVTFEGLDKPVKLYLNMYDKDDLPAPKGFIMK